MSWSKGYDMIQVYFEDYVSGERSSDEARKMAEFLGYNVKSLDLPVFLGGKEYRTGYYTEEEMERIIDFIRDMSYSQTWQLLKRYFL